MSIPIHERIPVHLDHNDEPTYWEPEIRAASTTVVDLPGGLLAVAESPDPDDPWTHVTLFAWFAGPATCNGVEVEPNCYQRIMHGDGPSKVLRELRHTFWGESDNSGYIFYPSGKLISAAFEALERWFDCE